MRFGKKHYTCKECVNAAQKEQYAGNKGYYLDRNRDRRSEMRVRYKALKESMPCALCGQRFPHYVTDFNHIDPSTKKLCVAKMMGHSWQAIEPGDPLGGLRHGASDAPLQSGRGWQQAASGEHTPTQTVATLREVLGDRAQDACATGACVSVLRPRGAARPEQRIGGSHRRAHAWNGRGGETETAGAATRQVNVLDPRNPRYNDASRLAEGGFIDVSHDSSLRG